MNSHSSTSSTMPLRPWPYRRQWRGTPYAPDSRGDPDTGHAVLPRRRRSGVASNTYLQRRRRASEDDATSHYGCRIRHMVACDCGECLAGVRRDVSGGVLHQRVVPTSPIENAPVLRREDVPSACCYVYAQSRSGRCLYVSVSGQIWLHLSGQYPA